MNAIWIFEHFHYFWISLWIKEQHQNIELQRPKSSGYFSATFLYSDILGLVTLYFKISLLQSKYAIMAYLLFPDDMFQRHPHYILYRYVYLLVLTHVNILQYKKNRHTIILYINLCGRGEKPTTALKMSTQNENNRKLHFTDIQVGPKLVFCQDMKCRCSLCNADIWWPNKLTCHVRLWEQTVNRQLLCDYLINIKYKSIKAVKLALCFYFQKRLWGHCIMSLNMCAIWKAICVTSTDRMTGLIDSI